MTMRAVWVIAGWAVAAVVYAADPDEARIEQLMTAPAAAAKATPAKPDKKAAKNETDSVASLVGQRVAIETRQRGIYIGTLTAVTRDAVTLAIQLPARLHSHTLPRGDIAAVTPR